MPGGNFIVEICRDDCRSVLIEGNDPQQVVNDTEGTFSEESTRSEKDDDHGGLHWTSQQGHACTYHFIGNQIHLLGSVGPAGGLAGVYIDSEL